MIGVIIGRFQPLHNGHVYLIAKAVSECSKVLIVVGSPDIIDERNPFTIDERLNMLNKVIKERGINNCEIFSLKDIPDDNKWVDHLKKNLPRFEKLYSGDKKDLELFKKTNFKLASTGRFEGISATNIREMIRKGKKSWKCLVPEEIIVDIQKKIK